MTEYVKKGIMEILRGSVRFVRWVIRLAKKSESSERQLPLNTLIQLAELRWTEANDSEMIKPSCPYCQNPMMFRHSKLVVDVGPVRDDQGWKCTHCFHTAHFGIPMTREAAVDEINLRGGQTLMRPSDRPDEDGDEMVKARLRRLGYIE